jgi:hypothetical protein
MHQSLRLLDIVIDLLQAETKAVDEGDDELQENLLRQRAEHMQRAWASREGCDAQSMTERLRHIARVQQELARRTGLVVNALRDSLNESRRQATRLTGYSRTGAHSGSVLLMDRKG